MVPNTINGIVLTSDGYSPNTYPTTNQTIATNAFDFNAVLDIGESTIKAGYFLAKNNLTVNDNTVTLPTSASVLAGNIWIATEGTVPDTLDIDSTQGNKDGVPNTYADGEQINVVPFPETGTLTYAWVALESGDAITVNTPLYIMTTGQLTIDPENADIANSAYAVGYILQASFTTAAATDEYQMLVVINPRYILQAP